MKFSYRTIVFFIFYRILWCFILPIVILRMWIRGKKLSISQRGYLERFSIYLTNNFPKKMIWVHAVSVGETKAAEPLIRFLLARDEKILLSHMTYAGRNIGSILFKKEIHDKKIYQVYLPYDIFFFVKKFFYKMQPKLGLIMETEIWPEILYQAYQIKLPIFLSNARLSQKSMKKFVFLGKIIKELLEVFQSILVQTNSDFKNFKQLGVNNVQLIGNTKFDVLPNQALLKKGLQIKKLINPNIFLICVASTRHEEEAIILRIWSELMKKKSNEKLRLLIIPRHPERFHQIMKLMSSYGSVKKRSTVHLDSLHQLIEENSMILGDTMGEMSLYYSLSDLIIMGGTIKPYGGQNFIEAAILKKPIILGPHCYNFKEASDDLLLYQGAIRFKNVESLLEIISDLIEDKKKLLDLSERAFKFSNLYIGASQKTMGILEPFLLKIKKD